MWSADPDQMWTFPARFLTEFFDNHGMLTLRGRPRWRTVAGGSQRYVEALTRPWRERLRLSTPVTAIHRHGDHVALTPRGGEPERFDHVVLATPDLSRTEAALAGLGLERRRLREAGDLLQAFYRLGPVILEVVARAGEAGPDPASLWGFTVVAEDLDALAARHIARRTGYLDVMDPGHRLARAGHQLGAREMGGARAVDVERRLGHPLERFGDLGVDARIGGHGRQPRHS